MTRHILLSFLVIAACGDDEPQQPLGDPNATELQCPLPGPLPFRVSDFLWQLDGNEAASLSQPRIKHQPADVLGNPSLGFAYTDQPGDAPLESGSFSLRGIMARVEQNRGLFADVIPEEQVSLWEYIDADGWVLRGETVTGAFSDSEPGGYELDGASLSDQAETRLWYAVLHAEPSCGKHFSFSLDSGRQVVITDIDGTLTASDDELLEQVGDGAYDPVQKTAAADVMQAWADKGYLVVYLTARPHVFRSETRAWLDQHEYPPGPVITGDELAFGDAARDYKAAWVTRVGTDLSWDIVAAYGNATSDIDAYELAGVPKSVTFIIGPEAGTAGTVAIDNDDYTTHLQDYVSMQPDAN